MRGFIRPKNKSSWQIVLYHGKVNGRSKYTYHTVKGDRQEAEKQLALLLADKVKGTYVKPTRQTFADFVLAPEKGWLAVVSTETALRTHERYREICEKHLIPFFGKYRLDKITSEMIQEYKVQALKAGRLDGKGGLSPLTVGHHLRVLHEIFEYAVTNEKLGRNPASSKRVKRPEVPEEDRVTLSAEEVVRVLEEVRRRKPRLFMPTLLAVTCGLRRGEVLGLRWCDVDLEKGKLRVVQTLQKSKVHGLYFKRPKSKAGRRPVDLLPMTAEALRRHREEQIRERKVIGLRPDREALVCANPDGSPIDPDYCTQGFASLVARTPGLPPVTFHGLRHTYATLLMEEGVMTKVVSEALGHSRTSITEEIYQHVKPTLGKEAARKLNDLLERAASSMGGRR